MAPAEITHREGVERRRLQPASATPPAASLGRRAKAMLLTCGLIVVTLGIGWLVWSGVEWSRGRTASFRLSGLRVVRRKDGRPIGLGRSILRNLVCCTVLLVPTLCVCAVIALAFVMGASPPSGLFRQPRRAPWDVLTGTDVVDERPQSSSRPRLVLGAVPTGGPASMN